MKNKRLIVALASFTCGIFFLMVVPFFAERAHQASTGSVMEVCNGIPAFVFMATGVVGIIAGVAIAIFGFPKDLT